MLELAGFVLDKNSSDLGLSIDSSVRLSTLSQAILHLDGKPFSLAHYPMFAAVYDGHYKKTLLKCGRQVAKSTTIAAFFITECIAYPHFKTLFSSPSAEQTNKFSNTRVGKMMRYSPLIKAHYLKSHTRDRVLLRMLGNGSEMVFTYASDDPDRARGNTADRVCYDEIQDTVYSAVVPVVNECMANSDYKYEIYAGTPKTMENGIEYLWQISTQSEWAIKCDGCGKYTYIISEKCFGKVGPECLNCRKPLNVRRGVWVDTNPGADIKGFHISQPILPKNVPAAMPQNVESQELAQERWESILTKLDRYGPTEFRNEVLGLSDAVGQRLLSKEELVALCTGPRMQEDPRGNFQDTTIRVAGIDWSGGGTKVVSRTVLWIWGWVPHGGKLRCLYYRVFSGRNPVEDVENIARIITSWGVSMVVGDAGEGNLPNAQLKNKLGRHMATGLRYCAAKTPIKWSGESESYMGDRTALIDNYMMLLKRGGVEFPPENEAQTAIEDILNEYEEVTTAGRKIWQHNPQLPDDCLHAGLFGWVAWKIVMGDLKMYV